MNSFSEYLCSANGTNQIITVTLDNINNLLDLDEEEIKKLIYINPKQYFKNKYSFNEFVYCIYMFTKEHLNDINDYIDERNKEKLNNLINLKYGNFLYVHSSSIINLLNTSIYYKDVKFTINKELENSVLNKMNSNYNKMERIIYYYFKLCTILRIDSEYQIDAIFNKSHTDYKREISRLDKITPSNNSVVCYEFSEIMKYFLRKENCLYKYSAINYGIYQFHTNVNTIINNMVFTFDAIELNKIPDLINVKMDLGYNGISVENITDEIKNTIDKVYKDVQLELKNDKKVVKYSAEVNSKLLNIIDLLDLDSSIKCNLKIDLLKLNQIPLKEFDYIIYLFNYYIPKLKKKYYNYIDIKFTKVITAFNDLEVAFILSIRQNDGYTYLLFGEHNIYSLDFNQMDELLLNNKIMPIQKHFISGLDEIKQETTFNNAKVLYKKKLEGSSI